MHVKYLAQGLRNNKHSTNTIIIGTMALEYTQDIFRVYRAILSKRGGNITNDTSSLAFCLMPQHGELAIRKLAEKS